MKDSIECPKCGLEWVMSAACVKWPVDKNERGETIRHHLHLAYVQCPVCKLSLTESDVARSLWRSRWRPTPVTAPDTETFNFCSKFLDLFKPRPIK